MDSERISGTLTEVAWRSPGTGRCILSIQTEQGRAFNALCETQALYVGERVVLAGYWSNHPPPARVFYAERVESSPPTDAQGLIRYLQQALDCDSSIASLIVSRFGDRTTTVLDESPERLNEIPGLDAVTVGVMDSAWKAARLQHRARSIMAGMRLSSVQTERLESSFAGDFEKLADELSANPYLAYVLDDTVDFTPVERYAEAHGADPAGLPRLRALILRRVRLMCTLGHTYVPQDKLVARLSRMLARHQLTETAIEKTLDNIVLDARLARIGDRIYLPRLYDAELRALEAIDRIEGHDTAYESATDWVGIDGAMQAMGRPRILEHHRVICEFALSHAACVIDIPRAGDDDAVVISLAHLFDALSVSCVVCSADALHADVLNAASDGLTALSLSSCLAYDDDRQPGAGPDAPIDAECVIVTHAEQLGIERLRDLCAALPDDCGLILMGDIYCQPSLAPGHPYLDLVLTERLACYKAQSLSANAAPARAIGAAWAGRCDSAEWIDNLDGPISMLQCPTSAIGGLLGDVYDHVLPGLGLEDSLLMLPSLSGESDAKVVREWLSARHGESVGQSFALSKGRHACVVDDINSVDLKAGYRVRVDRDRPPIQVTRIDRQGEPLGATVELPPYAEKRLMRDGMRSMSMLMGERADAVILVMTENTHPILAHQVMLYTLACAARRHLIVIGDAEAFTKALSRQRPDVWSGFAQLIKDHQNSEAA